MFTKRMSDLFCLFTTVLWSCHWICLGLLKIKSIQEQFCLKSWKFVYLWDGSAKQPQNFGISWHLALLIFGFVMFSLPRGKYATTTEADCSKGIHCSKYKIIRPGTRNKLFLVAFLRQQNLHMGQMDQDRFYGENCHFFFQLASFNTQI